MMPAQNQTTTSKTPPRRPRGSGSEWQDQRGTWHARKEIAPNPRTGKRRMVEAQAPTKTAARQRLQEKIKRLQREGDMPLAGTPTLDEWMERWLNTIAPNVKPRTLETYRSDCNTIRSVIGGMRLDRITPATIDGMCAKLAKEHRSKTVHNHYLRLRQVLDAAVRERLIPSNPALAATPPRYESQATQILEPGQPAQAAQAALDPKRRKYSHLADTDDDREMWSLMWNIMFETGMREAERFAILPEELATSTVCTESRSCGSSNASDPMQKCPTGSAPAITRDASGSSNRKASRATGSCPSATRRGADSGRSSDAGNASPASSYSRARDTRSPTPWNAAAGNALSKTPDCPTSPSEAPATSSPRTSPKPEPRKTREKR